MQVFVGSEDRTTFSTLPRLLRPFPAYWIPSRHFVMDMSASNRFVNIKQGNHRLLEIYGLMDDEAQAARKRGGEQPLRAALLKDEGMVLIAQLLLMSGCDAFIGSYSSNVAIVVHDLMLARKGSRGEVHHSIDVNGRVYCGCGASFCMTAERKAMREPARSVKQIMDDFRYRR